MFPVVVISALISLTIWVIVFRLIPRGTAAPVAFADVPDTPRAFGNDMAWIAIKSDNRDAIASAMGLQTLVPANWQSGIATLYDTALCDDFVFITPAVKGWTFVVGVPLPLPATRSFADKLTPLLTSLSAEFREVQYFASYPAIDLFAWAKLERGRMARAFAIGDEGVIWDRGRPTREERALGLQLFELRGIRGRKGDAGEAIILHPTQEHVLRLAASWGLNPSALGERSAAVGAGAVAQALRAWRPERIRKAA